MNVSDKSILGEYMGEIRIIVDLPNEDMQKALKIQPMYGNYDSKRLKRAMELALSREFPEAHVVKVNIIPANAFFGVDVMGFRTEDVLATMKKLTDVISRVIREEASLRAIRH